MKENGVKLGKMHSGTSYSLKSVDVSDEDLGAAMPVQVLRKMLALG